MTEHLTFCRFCHAFCGIKATVEDGRVVKIIGDKHNPMYFGFSCKKGRALPQQHYNPDRLLHSMKRQPDGSHEPVPVEQAMDDIAARLTTILEETGPRSVAMYTGTFAHHYPLAAAFAGAFMNAIGSPMSFSSGAIDQPGKPMAVAFHGRWSGGQQTFDEADVWMLVGANPVISMWEGIPQFNPAKRLHEAKKRGMKLVVIDPRKTECAEKADLHLQCKPGEDPTILAGIARIIIEEKWYDEAFVESDVEGFDHLRQTLEPFTPEYVAARADINAEDLVAAARIFAEGTRGAVTGGTGPNMAPRGALTEYMILVINTLCGRWLREGEQLPNPAFLPRPEGKAQAEPRPEHAWGFGEALRIRGLSQSVSGMPTAGLAEEILEEGEGRVRALISMGGNPMAAWPDQLRTYDAMRKLDLNITLDIKMSSTAKQCDYVIAPKMSLEVPSTTQPNENIQFYGVSTGYPAPYGQYSPKLVDPPAGAEVIEEWEFYYGLARRMGLALTVNGKSIDMENKPTSDELLYIIAANGRVSLDDVKTHPHGHIFEDPTIRILPKDEGWTHRLDVGNQEMMSELLEVSLEQLTHHAGYEMAADFSHRLISRRMADVYNSNGHDIPNLTRNYNYNPAFMNPADLAELDLQPGDVVRITSERASILGIVEEAEDVKTGAISMAHAWGDIPENDNQLHFIGSNTGRLTDSTTRFDQRTGMPLMSAIPVNVVKAEDPSILEASKA